MHADYFQLQESQRSKLTISTKKELLARSRSQILYKLADRLEYRIITATTNIYIYAADLFINIYYTWTWYKP